MLLAESISLLITAYSVLGLSLAIPFVVFGVGRVDPQAQGSTAAFRLIILPGVVALWPVVLARWIQARRP